MKQLLKPVFYKYSFMLLLSSLCSLILFAQDSTMQATSTTTSTSTTERTWYAEPWVWVVGGIVLLLLIVALTRGGGNGRTDRVTVTKTRTSE